MLEITHLKKDYYVDKKPYRAIEDLSLDFPDVQFVSVLGPSGCGKTTLLNCIGGLDSFDSGDILFDGCSLREMDDKKKNSYRNNVIGFVFQNYYLIPQLSVLDNVKVALEVRDYPDREITSMALDALKQVGVLDLKDKKPNQLSGGQAQRVAIARCLVTDPRVILADEPTGALDSANSLSIMSLLKELSKNRLVIMVTHNEELAKEYSDRIISMKDGKLVSDETIEKKEIKIEKKTELRKSRLSFFMSFKLAMKNVISRKWKTILSGIANSFGMIGIGFFLAINTGFGNYSYRINSETATSLPVVVPSYNQKNQSESYGEKNASALYPDVDEIYPKVDVGSETSYTYNHFSAKYFSYLDSLKKEGIVREYIESYGNDYSFNLATMFPASKSGNKKESLAYVDTTYTNYNSYAYSSTLPYNIFHVLYGNLDQYDVIAGSLPTDRNDLVLVVDKYNSVSFRILQKLGFYSSSDTQQDVEDESLKTKVQPIKFEDIVGNEENGKSPKTYKVFSNDERYALNETLTVKDGLGNDKQVTYYSENELNQEFYENHGTELRIKGILRPKSTSTINILNTALCYLPSLQESLMADNAKSMVSNTIHQNLLFRKDTGKSETELLSSFIQDLQDVLKDYKSGESSILPTNALNEVFNKYFCYYPFVRGNFYYNGFSTFLKEARTHGASLVMDELIGKDLSDENVIQVQLESIMNSYLQGDIEKTYQSVISIISYANAYSSIQSIVIFPMTLTGRSLLLEKLDAFNSIDGNPDHAINDQEQVYYVSSEANYMLEDIGEMISLASIILLIFAAISLVVSSSMTALLTSNNVLERKKEIGLLRSLGSRKSDVVRIFEIESIIVGTLTGIIGSFFTYVLSFPINALLNYYYPNYHVGTISDFVWYHWLIVTAFSVVVGMIAAWIPSLKAGRQNPVDALRSE